MIRARAGFTALLSLVGALHGTPAAAAKLQAPRFTREQMEATLADARPFRFVYGTRDPAFTATLRARATTLAVRAFGGDSTQVVADRDASDTLIAAGPVFLVGGPDENEWTRRLAAALPVRFEKQGFRWQGQLYDRPRDSIHLSWPNPLAPNRFLLLSAGNSPEALGAGSSFVLSDDDWRILRDGVLVRSGRFAQDAAHPWTYDPRRDRDREAERDRYMRALVSTGGAALAVRAPGGLDMAADVSGRAEKLLDRMSRQGLAAPAGSPQPTLTLYRSLEEKGTLTLDTHAEHAVGRAGGSGAPAAHAALPAGRATLDLWCVPALRLLQCGASPASRFLKPAAVAWAARFEGEPLERSISRLYFAGLLPKAAEAANRTDTPWRSPLVWVPARSLLVRAVWEVARPGTSREALLALVRSDPPGTLDSLCAVAHVPAAAVGTRYRALADSIARVGRRRSAVRHLDAWRPTQGFQRGVCLAHEEGVDRGYISAACARELVRIRDAGADWVALTPFALLADPRSPVLGNSTDSGPDGESDEAVCEAAARAHALGMRVWLKPQVWTRGWEGTITFNSAGWRQFFSGYDEILIHWALLAEREGLDGLFVGHELSSSTAADPERWRDMIGRVNRVYTGPLSYDANWDEVARVPFWGALDLIGVSFYAPLADRPTHDPGQLQAGAIKALAALHEVARRAGRPVLIAELGYPPTVTAAQRPWDGTAAPADPELQRLCLEAAIAAMDPQEWLAGAFFWRWGSGPRGHDDPFDPRGLPAEDVITRALKNWQGRPVRAPAAPAPAGKSH